MSKALSIEERVRRMRIGQQFMVSTTTDRERASKTGKMLKKLRVVEFEIVTKKRDGGYVVAAI